MDLIPVNEKHEIVKHKKKREYRLLKTILSIFQLVYEILKIVLFIYLVFILIKNYKNIIAFFSLYDLVYLFILIICFVICYFVLGPVLKFLCRFIFYMFKPNK